MKPIAFTYHLKDIHVAAAKVLEHLHSKTILFYGPMGAGKTTLISALLKAMQSKDAASSPSFSIVNTYSLPHDMVYHFDFYRIESIEEALNFGVEEYFNTEHWLFIEWPDRVEALLPKDAQHISITPVDDNTRSLKLTIQTERLTKTNAMTTVKI